MAPSRCTRSASASVPRPASSVRPPRFWTVSPREEATVTLPRWWMEIIVTFRDLYEPSEAEYRTHKVLNELVGKKMGRGETATRH